MIRRKRRNCGRRNRVISSEPIESDRPGTAQLHHSSPVMGTSPAPDGNGLEVAKEAVSSDKLEEDGGREKLQRYRSDVAGQVWIPDSSPVMGTSPAPDGNGLEVAKEAVSSDKLEEDGGREKLQRYRSDVAGQVWIPEIWGQEELMKDWVDCAAFDRSLVPSRIMSARDALVEECRRASSGGLRIENRC